MKKLILILGVVGTVFLLTETSEASLIDNGNGTITQIRDDPTYGDRSSLMWLKDANYADTSGYDDTLYGYDEHGNMKWEDANNWAAQLEYGGFDDWRLPRILPVNGATYNDNWSYDGTTDRGYNNTSINSEMAYLYYVELGNLGYFNTQGNSDPNWEFPQNLGPFINFRTPYIYWSENAGFDADPGNARFFTIREGYQETTSNVRYNYAWAVRDGDVSPVPEPSTMLLLAFGLVGLPGLRRKFRER